jgi:hypothetical protein
MVGDQSEPGPRSWAAAVQGSAMPALTVTQKATALPRRAASRTGVSSDEAKRPAGIRWNRTTGQVGEGEEDEGRCHRHGQPSCRIKDLQGPGRRAATTPRARGGRPPPPLSDIWALPGGKNPAAARKGEEAEGRTTGWFWFGCTERCEGELAYVNCFHIY